MNGLFRSMMWIAILVAAVWTALTVWVEAEGPARKLDLGNGEPALTALIVYDPDPLYNLDQQVCEAFGKGLAENGWKVTIATVSAAKAIKNSPYQLYVFCANTYNWLPDWSITDFISHDADINQRNIVTITVGAGSTGHSRVVFDKLIRDRNGNLIDSKTFWVLRPNDEARPGQPNVATAVEIARKWGGGIALLAAARKTGSMQ